jgi:hypothetical protein
MKKILNLTLLVIGIVCIAILIWGNGWIQGIAFFVLILDVGYFLFLGKMKQCQIKTS